MIWCPDGPKIDEPIVRLFLSQKDFIFSHQCSASSYFILYGVGEVARSQSSNQTNRHHLV